MFMEDSGSIKNNLEMYPSRKNKGHAVVAMDEYSKSPFFDGGGQSVDDNKQMGGNGLAIEEAHEGSANDDIIVDESGEEQQYPMRERPPLGEC